MNLVEVITAGLLFTLAASASLQLWSLAASGSVHDSDRQLQIDRLDAELVGLQGRLRRLARQGVMPSGCPEAVAAMAGDLATAPSLEGVERQLQPTADGRLLLVRVSLPAAAFSRQRLYSPAALGLCPALPPTLAEEGHDPR